MVKEERERQRKWFAKCPRASWRPRPVKRHAAYRWMLEVNNMIRSCTPLAGWEVWLLPTKLEDRGNPLKWPRLTIVCDRGSDGTAALAYIRHHFRLNVTKRFIQLRTRN